MSNKNELLSVGEVAKLTGASVQTLHYYERKNILKPTFVDPDTGYRYYSSDKIGQVFFIKSCVQLDIPLKEVTNNFFGNDMNHVKDFLEHCNEVSETKIKLLKFGVEVFSKALQKMELGKLYHLGQIYSRDFEEKYYVIKPCEQPLKGAILLKAMLAATLDQYENVSSHINEDDSEDVYLALSELGCLSQSSHKEINYYSFAEIPKSLTNEDSLTIPAGTYFFIQSESSRLEDACDIFKEQLKGVENFIIIETVEPFFSKTNINQPIYELRLIIL